MFGEDYKGNISICMDSPFVPSFNIKDKVNCGLDVISYTIDSMRPNEKNRILVYGAVDDSKVSVSVDLIYNGDGNEKYTKNNNAKFFIDLDESEEKKEVRFEDKLVIGALNDFIKS
jgi:hypothetical protein